MLCSINFSLVAMEMHQFSLYYLINLFQMNPDESHSSSRALLKKWLNKSMRIELTDGRILIGVFLCTDNTANVILGKDMSLMIISSVSVTHTSCSRILYREPS